MVSVAFCTCEAVTPAGNEIRGIARHNTCVRQRTQYLPIGDHGAKTLSLPDETNQSSISPGISKAITLKACKMLFH
jgi:hypothetical protein